MTDELVTQIVVAAFGILGGGAAVKAVADRNKKPTNGNGKNGEKGCQVEILLARHEREEFGCFADVTRQLTAVASVLNETSKTLERIQRDNAEDHRELREGVGRMLERRA